MAISIRARLRNAMIGLSLILCAVFTLILFLMVFTTEDRVFVKQLSTEKKAYDIHQQRFPGVNWVSSNQRFQLVESIDALPVTLSQSDRDRIADSIGTHEFFDSQAAYFVNHFKHPSTGASQFLVFDVSDWLAVRGNKLSILMAIILITLAITIGALMVVRRLVNRILEPVGRLSHELQQGEVDDVVIELANEFSEDEIGVLTHELAIALGRVRDAARREFEFNRGVSHELRSPIQIAQSATELLELRFEKEGQPVADYIGRLKRSMNEMNEVIEAFLWLASDRRAEQGDVYSVAELTKTVDKVQAVYPTLEVVIDTALASDFTFPLPAKVGAVIIRNLLRNALSHGEGKGINLRLTGDSISVSNHINHDDEINSEQGFGIGLAIVQRICERFEFDFLINEDQKNVYQASIYFNSLN